MSSITDWLMVIITLVYVIATIEICRANYKAANASKEQLEEMKKQYADENRAHIEMEFRYERRTWYVLRFVNHGKATAQHVRIVLEQEFIDSLPKESFRGFAKETSKKECIIGVDQHYDLYIGGSELRGNPSMKPVSGKVTYESNGKKFSTDIYLDLMQYMTFFSTTTDEEDMLKTVKAIEKDMRGIKEILRTELSRNEETENV